MITDETAPKDFHQVRQRPSHKSETAGGMGAISRNSNLQSLRGYRTISDGVSEST